MLFGNIDYTARFPKSDRQIVLLDGNPVGSVWLARTPDEIRIIDLAVLSDYRNQGIGTWVLQRLMAEAAIATATVNLRNVTIANNTADSDNALNVGSNGNGGGIYRFGSSTINLINTLVADNQTRGGLGPDISGTVNSQNFNLIENTAGAIITGTTTNNITGVDPGLGVLQNNGGLTATQAIGSSSAAFNQGTNTGAPTTDQRGVLFNRVAGGTSDIGAFEVSLPVIDVLDPSLTIIADNGGSFGFGSTSVGTNQIRTFTIRNTGADNLNVGNLMLPAGFSLVGAFPSTPTALSGSATFQVRLDAATSGAFSGTLSFNNNSVVPSDRDPYDFTISGTVDPPVVSLAVAPASVAENSGTPLVYTFTRSGATTNPLTVNFAVGGTATFGGAGANYTQSCAQHNGHHYICRRSQHCGSHTRPRRR